MKKKKFRGFSQFLIKHKKNRPYRFSRFIGYKQTGKQSIYIEYRCL